MERLGIDAGMRDLDDGAEGLVCLASPRPVGLDGEGDEVVGFHEVAAWLQRRLAQGRSFRICVVNTPL